MRRFWAPWVRCEACPRMRQSERWIAMRSIAQSLAAEATAGEVDRSTAPSGPS